MVALQSRRQLLDLYKEHGSWTAVASALGIARGTIYSRVARVGLQRDPSLDLSRARLRLPEDRQWLLDRDELRRRLQKYGSPTVLCAAEGVGPPTLGKYLRRHHLTPEDWVPNPADYGVQRYDTEITLEGDWVITGDYHLPYVDEHMVALACRFGRTWGIPNLLIAGDFLDLDQFSSFDPLTQTLGWAETKALASKTLGVLADAFPGQKVWSLGNHELRITRITKGAWGIPELVAALGEHGVRGIVTPVVTVQTPTGLWDVVHPASYSRIPTRVGAELATIYHRHQISFHGHLSGARWDVSGTYRIVDAGMMADPGRIAYRNLRRTTHPRWNRGFVLLRGGYAYPIDPHVDTEFWARAGKP